MQLIDIDSPTRQIVSYPIDIAEGSLGEPTVVFDFNGEPGVPDGAIVTCIGSEHNRSMGTLETTREEKAHMVRAVRPEGTVILNGDDPF